MPEFELITLMAFMAASIALYLTPGGGTGTGAGNKHRQFAPRGPDHDPDRCTSFRHTFAGLPPVWQLTEGTPNG